MLDRILPPRCLLCGDPGAHCLAVGCMALCAGCLQDLPRNERPCARCAQPLPGTAADLPELSVCGDCLWHPPPWAAIHVPFLYGPPLDWLVRRLKFHGDLAAGRLLGQLLARELHPLLPGGEAIVPVPLHPARLRERGYNQATELARPLARALGGWIEHGALERHGSRTPQMELSARERRRNVRRAFTAVRPPAADRVLLIDDVVTTASTVREAARALGGRPDESTLVLAALARA